jgi:hypothetical protein
MTLTQKINGVRKMKPTPHHKTAYKTNASEQSWLARHRDLFIQLAEEVGFEVGVGSRELRLTHDIGNFTVLFHWDREWSTIEMYGRCVEDTTRTYHHWRGDAKSKSHNDAHLGNWFLKNVREDWIESNMPPMEQIGPRDEIVFTSTPTGGGQRTRAKVIERGGKWGNNYFKVELLEERGVRKIKPVGSVVEVHYDCIVHYKHNS